MGKSQNSSALKHIQNFIDTSKRTDIFFSQTAFTEESCLHWKGFPIQIVIDVKLVITVMLYTFEKFRVGGACASITDFLSASLLATDIWAWSVAPITVHRWLKISSPHINCGFKNFLFQLIKFSQNHNIPIYSLRKLMNCKFSLFVDCLFICNYFNIFSSA